MEFRILGSLDVRNDAGTVSVPGGRPRALLALLLLHANEPVSSERIAAAIWGEDAPADSVATVRVVVSRLRRALDDAEIVATTPAGYVLRVRPGELDSDRFAALVDDGRRLLAAGDAFAAAATLRDALAEWRGPPLADVAFAGFAQTPITALEEQRLEALELRVEADLAVGGGPGLIAELQQLVREHPLRERLHKQLMLALYRAGRQAEALETYRRLRASLDDQLGLEPGRDLRELEAAILRQDENLEPRSDGAARHEPPARLPPAPSPATPPAALPQGRPSIVRRRFWLVTVATAAVVAIGMFAVRDQVFRSERGSAVALSESAYRDEIAGLCRAVTVAERESNDDALELRRALRAARTTHDQRRVIITTAREALIRGGENLATLRALEPPASKREIQAETARVWDRRLDVLRSYALRLDQAGTRRQLLAAIKRLSVARPGLDRDLVTVTAGLQRLGGHACQIRRLADVPVTLPPIRGRENGKDGVPPKARKDQARSPSDVIGGGWVSEDGRPNLDKAPTTPDSAPPPPAATIPGDSGTGTPDRGGQDAAPGGGGGGGGGGSDAGAGVGEG